MAEIPMCFFGPFSPGRETLQNCPECPLFWRHLAMAALGVIRHRLENIDVELTRANERAIQDLEWEARNQGRGGR
jgi:hypothetical protein